MTPESLVMALNNVSQRIAGSTNPSRADVVRDLKIILANIESDQDKSMISVLQLKCPSERSPADRNNILHIMRLHPDLRMTSRIGQNIFEVECDVDECDKVKKALEMIMAKKPELFSGCTFEFKARS